MSINYRDGTRSDGGRIGSGAVLLAILAVGGLLLFAPETAKALRDMVASFIRLPGT